MKNMSLLVGVMGVTVRSKVKSSQKGVDKEYRRDNNG